MSRPPQAPMPTRKAPRAPSVASEVDRASKAGKSILLVFTNEGLPGHKETVAAAHAYAASHGDTVAAVVADPRADAEFARRCRIPAPLTQTRIAILINGRAIVHAVAIDTEQAVDNAYRYALARSKCKRCGF